MLIVSLPHPHDWSRSGLSLGDIRAALRLRITSTALPPSGLDGIFVALAEHRDRISNIMCRHCERDRCGDSRPDRQVTQLDATTYETWPRSFL